MAGLVLPVAIVAATLVLSCGPPEPVTLTMLAGSELDDMLEGKEAGDVGGAEGDDDVGPPPKTGDPEFLHRLREDTGITLDVRFTGSLSGAETLTAGASYDLAWFASDAYLRGLALGGPSPIVKQKSIMRSPVVLGVKQSVADRYRWADPSFSWRNVAEKVAQEDPKTGRGFLFAMTDPAASNSGLSALVEATVATTGQTQLSGTAIENAVTPLQALFKGVGLTAGSSGWLSDQYRAGQSNLDGLVNYESEILALNQYPDVEELRILRPSDGVVTADYPLMLLSRGERHDAAYQRLITWLRDDWAQDRLASRTRRHRIEEAAGGRAQIALPTEKGLLDRLLLSYQDRIRKPPRTFYVVDKSASMRKARIAGSATSKLQELKEVFRELADDDPATATRFRRLRSREQVTILPFSDPVPRQFDSVSPVPRPRPAVDETIGGGQAGTTSRASLSRFVELLEPGGATALFDALYEAYVWLDDEVHAHGARSAEDYMELWYPSIVLLTDGDPNLGIDFARFEQLWTRLDSQIVRVFAVHIGEENIADQCPEPNPSKPRASKPGTPDLCRIAALTGGRVFDTSKTDLLDVLREIRGYQ